MIRIMRLLRLVSSRGKIVRGRSHSVGSLHGGRSSIAVYVPKMGRWRRSIVAWTRRATVHAVMECRGWSTVTPAHVMRRWSTEPVIRIVWRAGVICLFVMVLMMILLTRRILLICRRPVVIVAFNGPHVWLWARRLLFYSLSLDGGSARGVALTRNSLLR